MRLDQATNTFTPCSNAAPRPGNLASWSWQLGMIRMGILTRLERLVPLHTRPRCPMTCHDESTMGVKPYLELVTSLLHSDSQGEAKRSNNWSVFTAMTVMWRPSLPSTYVSY